MDTDNDDGRTTEASEPLELDMDNAAQALGISRDAVRKRIERGTLSARKVDDQWLVTVPLDGQRRTRSKLTPGDGRSSMDVRPRPTGATGVVELAVAQAKISGLEAQLAQALADRDRWHDEAVSARESAQREADALRALLSREQSIALAATTSDNVPQNAPVDVITGVQGHDAPRWAPEPYKADSLPWWRRIFTRKWV